MLRERKRVRGKQLQSAFHQPAAAPEVAPSRLCKGGWEKNKRKKVEKTWSTLANHLLWAGNLNHRPAPLQCPSLGRHEFASRIDLLKRVIHLDYRNQSMHINFNAFNHWNLRSASCLWLSKSLLLSFLSLSLLYLFMKPTWAFVTNVAIFVVIHLQGNQSHIQSLN